MLPQTTCCSTNLDPLPSLSVAGSALPVTAYDKNGFRILLHFARECPPGRSDVLVVVVSMLNTAPLPVRNIVLQAAVPKVGTRGTETASREGWPWTQALGTAWPDLAIGKVPLSKAQRFLSEAENTEQDKSRTACSYRVLQAGLALVPSSSLVG